MALDRDRSMQKKQGAGASRCGDNHVDRTMGRRRHCAGGDDNEAAAFPRIIVPENFSCVSARLCGFDVKIFYVILKTKKFSLLRIEKNNCETEHDDRARSKRCSVWEPHPLAPMWGLSPRPRGRKTMSSNTRLRAYLYACVAAGAISLPATSAFAVCQGPGAPTDTQTKCVTAITIPGNPLQSFDISWTNPQRAEYYFADRSNSAVEVIDTQQLTWKRKLTGFTGAVLNLPPNCGGAGQPACGSVNNDVSGPDGVVSHGRWLYAGDGDSTLKVYDLNSPSPNFVVAIPTPGGHKRLDEMALTTDGTLLLAANNADAPAFATLFKANGDAATNSTSVIARIDIQASILGGGSIEQPTWVPGISRFVVSIPQIAENPHLCTPDGAGGTPICQGGLLYVDPSITSNTTLGAFDPGTNTGVLPLHDCGPNGASTGPHNNVILGCTPQNVPTNTTTQVINVKTRNFVEVGNITGSDEVWFNKGDDRYYTGSNRAIKPAGSPLGSGAVLGVIDAATNFLIEKIPQSSGSHSVAADSKRNLIFVPEAATGVIGGDTNTTAGPGTATVGELICGQPQTPLPTQGCVAVYKHDVDEDQEEANHQGDDDRG